MHGLMRNVYRILMENLSERYHMGDLGINGKITLKYVIRK